jgi:hypothetical protein
VRKTGAAAAACSARLVTVISPAPHRRRAG